MVVTAAMMAIMARPKIAPVWVALFFIRILRLGKISSLSAQIKTKRESATKRNARGLVILVDFRSGLPIGQTNGDLAGEDGEVSSHPSEPQVHHKKAQNGA